jgi:DNA invertase Pin-like site-specific DNA recombinase/DNA-binding winged helix-turn-helix (wHTH) protein
MKATPLIAAAQYLRMSTDDQQYSIANQEATIQTYARNHGYIVTSNYADAGKSGIAIKHRKELRRLLSDVIGGRAPYKAILVYDVSRWGRFQDVDEAAHYEFLCKSAGIPVRYCAEQFENDGSMSSSMMKALKRTMAAEYSRELGIKTSAGQRRLALLGFRVGGMSGYGLRRMMVSPDGRRRLILKDGERKAIQTDRTILVPGPKRECDCVRTIFALAVNLRMTPREIAKELEIRHMFSSNGKPWDHSSVYRILTNDKYAGCNTYGKTTQELCSRSRMVERRFWTTNPKAFVPIVSRETFDRVQKLIKRRGAHPDRSDAYFIQGMKKVLAREGRLTKRILEEKFTFSHEYYKRFGSVKKAYDLAGFLPRPATVKLINTQSQVRLLRNELYIRLKQLFPQRLRFISLPGQQFRQIVEIDGQLRVSSYLCRAVNNTSAGKPGWLLRVRPMEKDLPVLICTLDQSHSQLLNFYIFLPFGDTIPKYAVLREDRFLLSAARKLEKLEDLCDVAIELTSQFAKASHYISVDDIQIAADTWTIILGKKEITLGPVGSALFNLLALNSGQVISRERLRRSVANKFLDTTNLNAHVSKLRLKLGEARDRIRRIPNVGYMYVSPTRAAEPHSPLPDSIGVIAPVDSSRPCRRLVDIQRAHHF